MRVSGDVGVDGGDTFGGVDHQQRHVRGLEMLSRHDDGELLRHELGLALATDTGGIDEAEFLTVVDDRVRRWRRAWCREWARRSRANCLSDDSAASICQHSGDR